MRWALAVLLLAVLCWPTRSQGRHTYYYVVTAVNTMGQESAYSNEANCTVVMPTDVCTLHWGVSPVIEVRVQKIYRGVVMNGPYKEVNSVGPVATTYSENPQITPPGCSVTAEGVSINCGSAKPAPPSGLWAGN